MKGIVPLPLAEGPCLCMLYVRSYGASCVFRAHTSVHLLFCCVVYVGISLSKLFLVERMQAILLGVLGPAKATISTAVVS